MKTVDAKALFTDRSKAKTPYFQLGYVSSDETNVDQIYYVDLPKEGVVELGNAAWGPATKAVSDTGDDTFYWFNPAEGVRAYVFYDNQMSWTMLKIDTYLAAESFVRDGLFVFENGSSLLGKDEATVAAQLTRADYNPERKGSFIPPTAFEEVNRVDFVYGEDGKASELSFLLYYRDDAQRDQFYAGLKSGLGEAKMDDKAMIYTSHGRTITVKTLSDKIRVRVTGTVE